MYKFYTYTIKGQSVEVHKTIDDEGDVAWYYMINDGSVEDHYFYKRTALRAATEWINDNY